MTEEVLGKVNALNRMCVTSALVADLDRGSVGYAASMWAHEDTLEWVSKLFQLVVASTILPVFSAILGYIFGANKSRG